MLAHPTTPVSLETNSKRVTAVIEGFLSINDHRIPVRILCDTGATCSNYFPLLLFNSLRKELLPVTQEYKHRATLGDQSTQVPIERKVTVYLFLSTLYKTPPMKLEFK